MHIALLGLLLRRKSSSANPPARPGFAGIIVVEVLNFKSYSFHNALQLLSSEPPENVIQEKLCSLVADKALREISKKMLVKNFLIKFIEIFIGLSFARLLQQEVRIQYLAFIFETKK